MPENVVELGSSTCGSKWGKVMADHGTGMELSHLLKFPVLWVDPNTEILLKKGGEGNDKKSMLLS